MKKLISLFLVLSTVAVAALPPTTSKIVGDTTDITTFKYRFPNFTGTHTGTTLSLALNSVAGGGTGLGTLTQNNVILGNGTASPLFVAPGAAGNVLTSDGTTWTSSTPTTGGTVTSVDLSMPAEFTVSNNPVTSSGTLTVSKASQLQNLFYASPNGASGAPTFRSITAADVPTLNQNTTGNAATSTALAANPTDCGAGTKAVSIDASGNLTCSAVALSSDVSGTLPVASGGTGLNTITSGSVVVGNGTSAPSLVAPGASGNVLTSNGTSWVSQAASSASSFATFAVSNWVATSTPADSTIFKSVGFGNNLFVALSGTSTVTNKIMTSPDAVTWTTRTAPTGDVIYQSLAYGNATYVAVGAGATTPSATTLVATSPDGVTWTARTAASSNQWTSVAYGAGLFVAVSQTGTGNRVMTSPDGITWTSRTSAADLSWQQVVYGGGIFVAVAQDGTGNTVMTSPDGITWTSRTPAANNGWQSVAYGNGLFVAVGASGTDRVMTSPDGVTWTSRTPAGDLTWLSIAYGSGMFVAVAQGTNSIGNIMTSPDGITWTRRVSPSNAWWKMTYGNGTFVIPLYVAGTFPRILRSLNIPQ